VGFEPTVRFPAHTRSRRAPSTTRPPLQIFTEQRRTIARCRPHATDEMRVREGAHGSVAMGRRSTRATDHIGRVLPERSTSTLPIRSSKPAWAARQAAVRTLRLLARRCWTLIATWSSGPRKPSHPLCPGSTGCALQTSDATRADHDWSRRLGSAPGSDRQRTLPLATIAVL
jgi:hypothetical protein